MALTFFGRPSHAVQLRMLSHITVRNPGDIATSGLASSAFARHYWRNLCWCLFLALLRCFSSGGSPHIPIWFSIWYLAVGFPIRKSPDLCSFAAPRSLSQLITSFIGSWCQGIPLALLLAWSISDLTLKISPIFGSLISKNYAGSYIFKIFCLAKIVSFYPFKIIYPLLLPSHNCINNLQCSVFKVHILNFLRNSMKFQIFSEASVNFFGGD